MSDWKNVQYKDGKFQTGTGGGGGGASALTDLSDVNISSVQDNQPLRYDSTSQKWVNGADNYPPIIYSGTEREVGVWKDGKPLYQKTYVVQNVGSSSVSVDANMTLSNVDLVGFIRNGLKMNSPYSGEVFEGSIAPDAHLRIWNSSGGLYCNIEGAGSGISGTARFTVQYTKSSDNAGSGIWTTDGGYAHHYSTSEKVVGTWIDGKPVYEITVDIGSNVTLAGNSWYTTSISNSNIKYIIDITAMHSSGTRWKFLGANRDSGDYCRIFNNRSDSIEIRYYTLQYTKTTD